MSLTAPTATIRLQRGVKSSEQSVARALAGVSGLFHSAALARAEVGGVSPAEGQDVLLRLHKSIGGLVEISGNIARVHGRLAEIGVERGTVDEPECPDEFFVGASANDAGVAA